MAYQAISTKYIGPANIKGSRVKAYAAGGSKTLHWDDALNSEQNHIGAAEALALHMQWDGTWYGGMLKSGEYCFVCTDVESSSSAAFHIGKRR